MRQLLRATRPDVYIPSLGRYASMTSENIEVNGFVERLVKSGTLVGVEVHGKSGKTAKPKKEEGKNDILGNSK